MRKFTNDCFSMVREMNGVKLSPDERYAVYTVRSMNLEKNSYETDIRAVDLATLQELRLTDGPHDSAVGFLSDGRLLFTSPGRDGTDPAKETVLFAMLPGGKAEAYVSVPAAGAMVIPVDDTHFLALTDEDRHEEADKPNTDWVVYDEYPLHAEGFGYASRQRTTLRLFDMDSGEMKPLLPEDLHVMMPFFTPPVLADERGFWFAGASFRGDRNGHEGLWFYDRVSGEVRELFNGPYYYYAFTRSGGRLLAHGWVYSGDRVGTMHLISVNETGGDVRVDDTVEWFPEAACGDWFVKVWQAHPTLCRRQESLGAYREYDTAGVQPVNMVPLTNGDVLVNGWLPGRLAELWLLHEGAVTQLSHLNDELYAECSFSLPVPLKVKDIHGWVIPPVDLKPGEKHPVVVYAHGGPHGYSGERMSIEHQRFVNEGYFFIFCNPHGSTGYGIEFTHINGECGVTDYREIMDFVDGALAAWPEMDADRMAFMGQSYGGYMANWVAGHTDRFRAICARMAISNWITMRGVSDEKWYMDSVVGATPWTDLQKCWDHSPLKYVRDVHTPLLIIQHEKDNSVPLEQGEEMLTPLLELGRPAKMVVNLGCGHGGKKVSQTIHDIDVMLDWFGRWLNSERTL